MLTNKELNERFNDLLKKKEKVLKVARVIRDTCRDLNIQIAQGNGILIEEMIEQSGQFTVLKKDYIATWQTLASQLESNGYDANVIEEMLKSLKFEYWAK